jgi:polyisoprenoid-binding protein YceI
MMPRLPRGLLMRTLLTAISVLLAPWSAAHIDAAEATYDVAEAKSSVRIHVGRSGAFSFVGHKHEVQAPVSGTVTADPANLSGSSVDLTFASARLHVMPEGEPTGDAPKVEAVMRGPAVLDVIRFSEIRFRSTKVTGRALAGGGYDLVLVGELSLHGVTREITLPVQVTLNGRSLAATARTKLRHDQFGMKPVSVGGGLVKVANEIQIEFQIVAEQR